MNPPQILLQEESPEGEGQCHGGVGVATGQLQIKEKNWNRENPETYNIFIVLGPFAMGTNSVKSHVGNEAVH